MTLKHSLLGLTLLALLGYAAVLTWIYFKQEKLLFFPEPLPANHRFAQDADVHEVSVPVPGASLSVLELRLPKPRGVVFFLHGNAGNLDTWFINAAFYRALNYDLVMLDYRGYGKSTGRISSEAELRADVRAVWNQVAPRYQGLNRVILGRSLGSGLAAGLAREIQPELTVLVSPYFSVASLAQAQFPWVPSRLLRYPLRTCDDLAAVKGPVLLIHGDQDALIPLHHSEQLLSCATQARLLRIENAAHNDLQAFPSYVDGLREALLASESPAK